MSKGLFAAIGTLAVCYATVAATQSNDSALSKAPSIVRMDGVIGDWRQCVIAKAVGWARSKDPADVLADGAMGACSSLEQPMIKAMGNSPIAGMALPRNEAQKVIEGSRAMLRRKAIASVLDARNAASK